MTDNVTGSAQCNNVQTPNRKPIYPYAEWMLSEIKNEYAVERERENKIGTKASAFITVIVAIITLYIPMIPFENFLPFWYATTTTNVEMALMVICIIVMSGGLILLLVAFGFFIKAYGVKGYKRVMVDDLLNIANLTGELEGKDRDYIAQGIVAHYHTILRGTLDEKGNMEINSESADIVAIGIVLTVIGFVLLSIATIALRIVVVIA